MTTTDPALLTAYAEALAAYATARTTLSARNHGLTDRANALVADSPEDVSYWANVCDVANASETLRRAAADADICERQHDDDCLKATLAG